jgi:hypothetical protein
VIAVQEWFSGIAFPTVFYGHVAHDDVVMGYDGSRTYITTYGIMEVVLEPSLQDRVCAILLMMHALSDAPVSYLFVEDRGGVPRCQLMLAIEM